MPAAMHTSASPASAFAVQAITGVRALVPARAASSARIARVRS
jgi:hypothetical protein